MCTAVLNDFLDRYGSAPTSATSAGSKVTTAQTAPQLPVLSIPSSPNSSPAYSGRYPTTIGFSEDGGNVVGRISWSSWGPEQAIGHGIWSYLDCVPSCAQGSDTPYPATITLSDPADGLHRKITEVTSGPHGFTYTDTYGSQSWNTIGVQ